MKHTGPAISFHISLPLDCNVIGHAITMIHCADVQLGCGDSRVALTQPQHTTETSRTLKVINDLGTLPLYIAKLYKAAYSTSEVMNVDSS